MNYRREAPGRLYMPRSRGAMSGLLLIILGALIPFLGPYLHFAYTPDQPWVWNVARGWLEVLPGVVAAVGGLLLLLSGNRATAMLGGWLAVAGGAWFVVGRSLAPALRLGSVGDPIAVTDAKRAALEICYFSGLGALIVFLGAAMLGRVSVRAARDLEYVTRDDVEPLAPASDDYAASAPVAAAAAPTEVIDTSRAHDADTAEETRREPKRGLFRRRRVHVGAGR
ncbi:hypothetical protein [Mycobacterium paraterrae]